MALGTRRGAHSSDPRLLQMNGTTGSALSLDLRLEVPQETSTMPGEKTLSSKSLELSEGQQRSGVQLQLQVAVVSI